MEKKPGILKLVETDNLAAANIFMDFKAKYNAIIVTDEPIQVDDKFLDTRDNTIQTCDFRTDAYISASYGPQGGFVNVNEGIQVKHCKKILVLPEQIPQNILDAIVAGKLKEDDVVNVGMTDNRSQRDSLADWDKENHLIIQLQERKAIVEIPEQDEWNEQYYSTPDRDFLEPTPEQSTTSDVEEAAKQYIREHFLFEDEVMEMLRDCFKAGIEWRDKNPKSVDSEYKKITGFDTPKELAAYDKGREHEQSVIMKWISQWKGTTNSAMGELLYNKLNELSTKPAEWSELVKDCIKEYETGNSKALGILVGKVYQKGMKHSENKPVEPDILKAADNIYPIKDKDLGGYLPIDENESNRAAYIKGRQDGEKLSGKMYTSEQMIDFANHYHKEKKTGNHKLVEQQFNDWKEQSD